MTQPIKAIELKPCPFCGGKPTGPKFSHEAGQWDFYEVECDNCFIGMGGSSGFAGDAAAQSAADVWNTRATLEASRPVDDMVGALRGALGALLGDMDWRNGACKPTEMVGAVVNSVTLLRCDEAMKLAIPTSGRGE